MVPLRDALSDADREHLRRVARGAAAEYLQKSTYVAPDAREPFRKLPQWDRDRLLSDLAWRVTCILDGSVTQVQGVKAFELDGGFTAVKSEWKGEGILCLVAGKE